VDKTMFNLNKRGGKLTFGTFLICYRYSFPLMVWKTTRRNKLHSKTIEKIKG
jgi:hypothetical protein